MKIALACDHAGFELKEKVKKYLTGKSFEVRDLGCYSPERVDYPLYGEKAANAVATNECEAGVLICGTGIGISLAANKVKGIRAAVCSEPVSARLAKEHNNANIIAFGARIVGEEMAYAILDAYFAASFQGGRHAERVNIISGIEEKNFK